MGWDRPPADAPAGATPPEGADVDERLEGHLFPRS